MQKQELVAVGVEVLSKDVASQQVLSKGLDAFVKLMEAAEAVHEPEQFLRTHFDWEQWDQTLRQSLERFGLVFFRACQKRLLERRAASLQGDVHPRLERAPALESREDFAQNIDAGPTQESDKAPGAWSVVDDVALKISGQVAVHPVEEEEGGLAHSIEVPTSAELSLPVTSAAMDPVPAPMSGHSQVVERSHKGSTQDLQDDNVGVVMRSSSPARPAPEEDVTATPAPTATVTPDMLAKLQQHMSARSWNTKASRTVVKGTDPTATMKELKGRGQNLIDSFESDPVRVSLLAVQLSEASSKSLLEQCADIPAKVQRVYVELVAALARVFQERHIERAAEVNDVFARLTCFIDDGHLGFVYGLARAHTPQHGSWMRDARQCWRAFKVLEANGGASKMDPGTGQRLVEEILDTCEDDEERQRRLIRLVDLGLQPDTRVLRLLAPVHEALSDPALRSLRRRVRDQIQADDQGTDDEGSHGALPDDWPLMHLTAGRPAVMIGSIGKRRELDEIQEAFGFSSLNWVDSCRSLRRVQAIASSMQPGDERVFLVMHRYMSHKASDMIWSKRRDATVIGVDKGFGVHAVRQAIERYAGHTP